MNQELNPFKSLYQIRVTPEGKNEIEGTQIYILINLGF